MTAKLNMKATIRNGYFSKLKKILVIEDLKYLTDVIENINNASEDSVFAIIFNSNYISTDTIIQFRRVVIPVFYTDNQTITGLKQYDVKKENLNLFIEISCISYCLF